jgi:hypothetical protein
MNPYDDFGRTSGVLGPWQAKVDRNLAGVQQLTGVHTR